MIALIQKIKGVINKRILRTPGVEYLVNQGDNLETKKKHINFWINCSKKKKSFKKYFFDKTENINSKLSFNVDNENFEITKEITNALSNNGLVILKNALPEDERNQIIEYFEDLKEDKQSKKWIKGPIFTNAFKQAYEIFGSTEIKNFKFLDKISQKFSKEIYGKIVEPTVEMRYLKMNESFESDKTKGNTYIHTDRFLPHFKIFYTPYEITENDAPLQYLLSSHKINEKFLDFFANSKTFDETDEKFKNFYFQNKTVLVPKNSLYIAFTNGFHKRSQFRNKTERSMVFLQYVERYNKIDYLF